MFIRYPTNRNLGQYLLNKGLLTIEQIRTILEVEQKARIKIEILALSYAMMTAKQIERVHVLQNLLNKRFGDVAVECGYLSEKQLEMLLEAPENENINFSQCVIDCGYMTLEEFEKALGDFCNDDKPLSPVLELPRIEFPFEGALQDIYLNYIRFMLALSVRLLHTSNITLRQQALPENTRFFKQCFIGKAQFCVALSGSETTLLRVASRYADEEIARFDELAIDVIKEFLNLVNGFFCIHLSNQGLELELAPALYQAEHTGAFSPIAMQTEFGELFLAFPERAM